VLRRCPAFLATLAVALLLAARPTAVLGAGIITLPNEGPATYQLTNTNPDGTTPVTKVVANVIPAGAITPPDPSSSPLTILPNSSGFNDTHLTVLLGEGQTPDGNPLQALALDFGSQGFAPGGVLNFALNIDQAFHGAPVLELPDDATGLTLAQMALPTAIDEPTDNGSGSNVDTTGAQESHVPEPMSIMLWCTGALTLTQVRRWRQRRIAGSASDQYNS
jgi:hypothetical protein